MRCPHPHRWKCTQTAADAPKTIGEHIRKRRLALHMMQQEVADRFGVHKGSVQNWERGTTEPALCHIPKIVEFLGFDPQPEPHLAHERLAYARRRLGMTQEELADVLKVDSTTIWRWERGDSCPEREKLDDFKVLLGDQFRLLTLGSVSST